MDISQVPRSPRSWPWAAAILLLIIVNGAFFSAQRGECFDYTVESGAVSTCASGPALGVPGTWLLAIVSVTAVVCFARRLVQGLATRKN